MTEQPSPALPQPYIAMKDRTNCQARTKATVTTLTSSRAKTSDCIPYDRWPLRGEAIPNIEDPETTHSDEIATLRMGEMPTIPSGRNSLHPPAPGPSQGLFILKCCPRGDARNHPAGKAHSPPHFTFKASQMCCCAEGLKAQAP